MTRISGFVVYEVDTCNPNGDPDANGYPRQLGEFGLITPMAIKRKVRDLVDKKHPAFEEACSSLKIRENEFGIAMKKYDKPATSDEIAKMINDSSDAKLFDVRVFGGFYAGANKDKEAKKEEARKVPSKLITE